MDGNKLIFNFLFLVFFSFLNANELKPEKLVSNLEGVPWGMTFINNKEMLISLKSGKLLHLDLINKKVQTLKLNIDVSFRGQGGLMDIKKSPNFALDNYIYLTYVKNIEGTPTTLARVKYKDKKLYGFEDLLITKSQSDTVRHFGSRITFDEKNFIYFSVGDRGVRKNSQDLLTHAGSILRLNLDGSIPKDNPFIENKKALNEIYSYGHRNPQGIFYDRKTHRLWINEHGPRGGDEINLIKKSKNYGWPIISYGKEYWAPLSVGEGTHKKGMEQAIKYYIPSIAPSSLLVYSGKKFKKLEGKLLAGSLVLTHLNVITLDKQGKFLKEDRLFENLHERIRNVVESPSGEILFSTDNGNIYILK